jgi:molybdopterin-containing oxidoreductase family membrane subunit
LNTEELEPKVIDPGPDKIIAPGFNYTTVTDKIANVVLKPIETTPKQWWISLFLAFVAMQGLAAGAVWLFYKGVGVWGIVIPVAWGFAIVNFVWWIGIGHAGTLISAILLLLKQDWRTSINRFSEAMTLFAVAQAGMFPILHLGRPWLGYWLIPYPNSMWLWPQPRSPLIWDVFAVTTYLTVSLIFWFIGLVPDLATMRDRAKHQWQKFIFGALGMGWRGSAKHWARYQMAYLLLGGLATPLVVSVHTVVSFDFAISLLPGWHTTIFPPYFVAGAIYSGFAMVVTLAIPARKWFHLEDLITMRHLDCMGKLMLATGLIVGYGYMMEAFMSWYSGNPHEMFMYMTRATGPYRYFFWSLILCNILIPQSLWSAKVRQSIPLLFMVSIVVNIGMWLERFIIVITSLARDFVPSSWGMYYPTQWDWAVYVGTLGFFLVLMILFVRVLPSISIFEVREVLHHLAPNVTDDGPAPVPAPAHGD